jgi:hypothetical protein
MKRPFWKSPVSIAACALGTLVLVSSVARRDAAGTSPASAPAPIQPRAYCWRDAHGTVQTAPPYPAGTQILCVPMPSSSSPSSQPSTRSRP